MTQSLSWLIFTMQIQRVNKFKHLTSWTRCSFFAGDFNLFFDCSLDAKGNSLSVKKHSLSKLLEIKQKLDLCDIWPVRNPKKMQYTFRQQQFSGLIKHRLDYIFVSHNLQEVVKDSEILRPMSTDHSAFVCSFQRFNKF